MGLFSFNKAAGSEAKDQTVSKAQQLENTVKFLKFPVENLSIAVQGDKAIIYGDATDLETKEKVVLIVGNTLGIASVEDNLTVAGVDLTQVVVAEEEVIVEATRYHTVVKGDTLSLIAKAVYGDMMKYPIIFEANKPMLEHEDRIYPGQVLRIPALTE